MRSYILFARAVCVFLTFLPTTAGDTSTGTSLRALLTQEECFDALSQNDGDLDDRINRTEYVGVVNDLMGTNVLAYDDLPRPLRGVFVDLFLASTRSVSFAIFGTKPGQDPTEEQETFLELVCQEIEKAMDAALDPSTPSESIPSPAPSETAPTTTPFTSVTSNANDQFQDCFAALNAADTDKNILLDRKEYVDFLNIMSDGLFENWLFVELPSALQVNFVEQSLKDYIFEDASGIYIYIVGVDGQTPVAPIQAKFLEQLCSQTNMVLESHVTSLTTTSGAAKKIMAWSVAAKVAFVLACTTLLHLGW